MRGAELGGCWVDRGDGLQTTGLSLPQAPGYQAPWMGPVGIISLGRSWIDFSLGSPAAGHLAGEAGLRHHRLFQLTCVTWWREQQVGLCCGNGHLGAESAVAVLGSELL